MRIVVRDTPAPQGSKRHVGRGVMVEMSKNVKPWREAVRFEAQAVRGLAREPLSGPVRCWVTFTVRKPAGAPKTRKTWPAKRPDVDKLLRSTLDALVVDVRGVKVYPGEGVDALEVPGAVIDVEVIA
jgi:Holliday junction resolvase RusA-like endonuclease